MGPLQYNHYQPKNPLLETDKTHPTLPLFLSALVECHMKEVLYKHYHHYQQWPPQIS